MSPHPGTTRNLQVSNAAQASASASLLFIAFPVGKAWESPSLGPKAGDRSCAPSPSLSPSSSRSACFSLSRSVALRLGLCLSLSLSLPLPLFASDCLSLSLLVRLRLSDSLSLSLSLHCLCLWFKSTADILVDATGAVVCHVRICQ